MIIVSLDLVTRSIAPPQRLPLIVNAIREGPVSLIRLHHDSDALVIALKYRTRAMLIIGSLHHQHTPKSQTGLYQKSFVGCLCRVAQSQSDVYESVVNGLVGRAQHSTPQYLKVMLEGLALFQNGHQCPLNGRQQML